MTRRETKFLEKFRIFGAEQDEVDVAYLRNVHFETWAETWRFANDDDWYLA